MRREFCQQALSTFSGTHSNAAPFDAVAAFEHDFHRFSINAMFLRQNARRERVRRVVVFDRDQACITIGPASRFSSTKWTVHPENFAPCSMAWRCDSRPGNAGSSDGWMFKIAIRKRGDEMRREQPHVAREADKVYVGFLQRRDDQLVVRFPLESL